MGLLWIALLALAPAGVEAWSEGHPAGVPGPDWTVVDLGDDWAPTVLDGPPGDRPAWRDTYVADANERFTDDRAREDRYLELYGIPPSFSVLRARLADDARHRCHEAVDDAALAAPTRLLVPWEPLDAQRARVRATRDLGVRLERERARAGVPTLDALDRRFAKQVERYRRDAARLGAVAAMQAHLRCEGGFDPGREAGLFGPRTQVALERFQRRAMLTGRGLLDADTRRALAEDSREQDFRAALRALRERVVDATGRIEDGSARNEWRPVLGRDLDAADFRAPDPRGPLPDGAPDLVSEATEAAAIALGWTSPDAVRAFLEARSTAGHRPVALPLPPPPPWSADAMDLRAEIDRGDVWRRWPYDASGHRRAFPMELRPVLVLYARHAGGDVALVRWPTTIGGWQKEQVPGAGVLRRYKESPVGTRVWRRLVAAPAWIPPTTTPPREIVRRRDGAWAVDTDLIGPGYASAYGLAMLVHERPWPTKKGETIYADNGVRTHGSVSYRTIGRGESHGCHRLFNHQALRLTGFLLQHRPHRRDGPERVGYERRIPWRGRVLKLRVDDRGYGYTFDPPIPVEVLEGRLRGGATRPMAARAGD